MWEADELTAKGRSGMAICDGINDRARRRDMDKMSVNMSIIIHQHIGRTCIHRNDTVFNLQHVNTENMGTDIFIKHEFTPKRRSCKRWSRRHRVHLFCLYHRFAAYA